MSHLTTIPKTYPLRQDNTVNLSAMAIAMMKWTRGVDFCQITVDKKNECIIVSKVKEDEESN